MDLRARLEAARRKLECGAANGGTSTSVSQQHLHPPVIPPSFLPSPGVTCVYRDPAKIPMPHLSSDDFARAFLEGKLKNGGVRRDDERSAKRLRLESEEVGGCDVTGSLASCRSVDVYEPLGKISEGVYGVVIKGVDPETKKVYALKEIKGTWLKESQVGFPTYLLREFDLVMRLRHPNIVHGHEIVFRDKEDDENDGVGGNSRSAATGKRSVYLVTEFCKTDLKVILHHSQCLHLSSRNVSPDAPAAFLARAKCVAAQMLRAVAFLHSHGIIHRDIKTSNILVDEFGVVKVCDFGLARFFREGVAMTPTVVTLMYRAPELHFSVRDYSSAVDVWSVACIICEIFLKAPLFRAHSETEHFQRVCDVLGIPDDTTSFVGFLHLPTAQKMMKGLKSYNRENKLPKMLKEHRVGYLLGDSGVDLLCKMLKWNPMDRITAKDALAHPFFCTEQPLPSEPCEIVKKMPFASRDVPSPKSPHVGAQEEALVVEEPGLATGGLAVGISATVAAVEGRARTPEGEEERGGTKIAEEAVEEAEEEVEEGEEGEEESPQEINQDDFRKRMLHEEEEE